MYFWRFLIDFKTIIILNEIVKYAVNDSCFLTWQQHIMQARKAWLVWQNVETDEIVLLLKLLLTITLSKGQALKSERNREAVNNE